MKNLIYIIAAALMMCGCNGGVHKHSQPSSEQTLDSLVQRVEEIYSSVFKAYNAEDSSRRLGQDTVTSIAQNRDRFDAKFCTREWNDLVQSIHVNDSLFHEGEIGFFEADYWIMGQDWDHLSISDVTLDSIGDTPPVVSFVLHNLGTSKSVNVVLLKEEGSWKIDNFIDMDNFFDWKQAMLEYVQAEARNNRQ